MEKYSKAVSEMYSQFKQSEAHPLEKYIGRHITCAGRTREVVGYTTWLDGSCSLIVDASEEDDGWDRLGDGDVVFKECEYYWYVNVNNLIY